jgi:GT2 family glycosyltransferase
MDGRRLTMSSKVPVVSVCVANFNGAAVVVACLESVYAQHFAQGIELIVHDDASTDGSLATIRDRFPKAIIIASEENVGFCVANNRMVERATGEYILLLNNDAWLAESAINTCYRAAIDNTRSANIYTLAQYDASTNELLDCGMLMDIFANPVAVKTKVQQPVAMVMGACLWIPKKRWLQCGGLPEWFGSLAEDMYLCHYVRLLGGEVMALTDSRYYHHVGHSFGGGKVLESGLATTFKRRRLSERNKLYVMFLFYPLLPLMVILPLHLLGLLLEGLLLSLVKRDFGVFSRIYGVALAAFVCNSVDLCRRRRAIQAQRIIGTRKYFSVYRWIPHKIRMLIKHGIPKLN